MNSLSPNLMSAELAHFKCGRCSVAGNQPPNSIWLCPIVVSHHRGGIRLPLLWHCPAKRVVGYPDCGILPIRGALGYPLLWHCACTCPFLLPTRRYDEPLNLPNFQCNCPRMSHENGDIEDSILSNPMQSYIFVSTSRYF